MQTLKTAAIVVLLMTIIYGAYVSLTTPTEPMPPEVDGALVMSEQDAFLVDDGLPESLGSLAFDPGTSESGLGSDHAGLDQSLATLAPPTPNVPVTGTLSDQSDSLSSSAGGDSGDTYANTGQQFQMPAPRGLDPQFQTASSKQPNLSFPGMPGADVTADSAAAEDPEQSLPPEWSVDPGVDQVASSTGLSAPTANVGVSNAIRTADQQYGEDKLKEALTTMSLFYDSPQITAEQRTELLSRLDPLAREVIYSKRHLLEQPHRVRQTETLMTIAKDLQVPWQLLANINQINDPIAVLPGTELKVVRGPFRADVDLASKELTVFLGDLYAGRFPIEIGNDPAPQPGTYTVQDKEKSHTYYNAAGSPVPADSPDNPYGQAWLDLGGRLCIHGSPSTAAANNKGCISLAGDYAEDLYGILSQGSSVTIRR